MVEVPFPNHPTPPSGTPGPLPVQPEQVGADQPGVFPEDRKLLDHVHDLLLAGHVGEGLEELFLTLNARRLRTPADEWATLARFCLGHPLRALLHQDPFTRHAFAKPRGYPGDAALLDFVYAHDDGRPLPPGVTDLGRAVHQFVIRTPACEGVRTRREFVAGLLDDLGAAGGRPHVLSVASGHLREVDLSAAVKRRRLGRLVAIDADPESLVEVERCYGRYGVEPVVFRVRNLLSPSGSLGQFDLIYSTGLFDYLRQGTAQRLSAALFRSLRPRGRLVIANFLPGIPDRGYMESYMGWDLIYRTRAELLDVVAHVPQNEVRDIRLFTEEHQNIIFLQVTRAG